MEKNKIISSCQALVIGGSAGSLEVLLKIFPGLNKDLAFPIVVVLHRKRSSESSLADLLSSRSPIPVKEIEDKQAISPGCIYIAPADYHVLFEGAALLSLDYSEKINYSRPSIDVTFESASEILGQHVICMILSGANSDGALGSRFVKQKGGLVWVQDPETAESPYMPLETIAAITPDAILKPAEIAAQINSL